MLLNRKSNIYIWNNERKEVKKRMAERKNESMTEQEVENMLIKHEMEEYPEECTREGYTDAEMKALAKRDWMKMKEQEYDASL